MIKYDCPLSESQTHDQCMYGMWRVHNASYYDNNTVRNM